MRFRTINRFSLVDKTICKRLKKKYRGIGLDTATGRYSSFYLFFTARQYLKKRDINFLTPDRSSDFEKSLYSALRLKRV